MFRLATVQGASVLDWLKGPIGTYEGASPTAEADELRTCHLRGGPLDGDELQVESFPQQLSVEKHYAAAAPRMGTVEEGRTRTHRYRMTAPCRDGFIYVYDGSA